MRYKTVWKLQIAVSRSFIDLKLGQQFSSSPIDAVGQHGHILPEAAVDNWSSIQVQVYWRQAIENILYV